MESNELQKNLARVCAALQEEHDRHYEEQFPDMPENCKEKIIQNTRRKFVAIDIGNSGAWLVERTTGEIFNIKGYGTADRNKKAKADIGNIATVDPAEMYRLRWNYLR